MKKTSVKIISLLLALISVFSIAVCAYASIERNPATADGEFDTSIANQRYANFCTVENKFFAGDAKQCPWCGEYGYKTTSYNVIYFKNAVPICLFKSRFTCDCGYTFWWYIGGETRTLESGVCSRCGRQITEDNFEYKVICLFGSFESGYSSCTASEQKEFDVWFPMKDYTPEKMKEIALNFANSSTMAKARATIEAGNDIDFSTPYTAEDVAADEAEAAREAAEEAYKNMNLWQKFIYWIKSIFASIAGLF